jgi:hypothetical protein
MALDGLFLTFHAVLRDFKAFPILIARELARYPDLERLVDPDRARRTANIFLENVAAVAQAHPQAADYTPPPIL